MSLIHIVTIPGIGSKEEGYSKKFQEDIVKFLKRTVLKEKIKFYEALPFNVTDIDNRQRLLFNRLNKDNKLGGMLSLREFVLGAFGDGVTFERGAHKENSPYRKIHSYLKSFFEYIYEKMGSNSKLVIVAGSLGAHILSTYIWDADNNIGIFKNEHANEKNNLSNLSFLATIGANIPLFISGYKEEDIKPISASNRAYDFKWHNYYDKDDVLGWPLKQLSSEYGKVVEDFQINTGLYIGSHIRYWSDDDFTKPFTKYLVNLVEN